MSRVANDWAWSLSIKPASLKLILLAMADRADEIHQCFPSISRLLDDTCLDRKTVQAGLTELQKRGLIKDTGERKGTTQRVKVFALIGVEKGVKQSIPKSESSQKRDNTENGTNNDPEIGILNDPENGTQNQSVEPPIEPPSYSREAKTQNRATKLPENFEPNETCRKKAKELGVDISVELEKFKDHALANGKKFKDWQAALRTWLRNAKEFQDRYRKNNVHRFPSQPVNQYGPEDSPGPAVDFSNYQPEETYEEYKRRTGRVS